MTRVTVANLPDKTYSTGHAEASAALPAKSRRPRAILEDRPDLAGFFVIDVATIVDGWFGDTSEMFTVGRIATNALELIDRTREAMWLGIGEVAPGKTIGDIGAAIYEFARGHGYSVVEQFCGHGIGREMHMAPQVPHIGRRATGVRLRPGMTFTIEPMLNEGVPDCDILADQWTAVTRDRKLSAQTEHTVLVTDRGHEVLTMRESAWRPRN
jgi:methionyl aminopeptidase